MQKKALGSAALAAVIIFAPGGFLLGAALAARHARRLIDARRAVEAEPATPI